MPQVASSACQSIGRPKALDKFESCPGATYERLGSIGEHHATLGVSRGTVDGCTLTTRVNRTERAESISLNRRSRLDGEVEPVAPGLFRITVRSAMQHNLPGREPAGDPQRPSFRPAPSGVQRPFPDLDL